MKKETSLDKNHTTQPESSVPESSVDAVLSSSFIDQIKSSVDKYETIALIDSIGNQNLKASSVTAFSERDGAELIGSISSLKDYIESSKTDKEILSSIVEKFNKSLAQLLKDSNELQEERKRVKQKVVTLKSDLKVLEEAEAYVTEDQALYHLREKIIDSHQVLQVSLQEVLGVEILIDNTTSLLQVARKIEKVTIPALLASRQVDQALVRQEQLRSLEVPEFKKKVSEKGRSREVYEFEDDSRVLELLDFRSYNEVSSLLDVKSQDWEDSFREKSDLKIYVFQNKSGQNKFMFAVKKTEDGSFLDSGVSRSGKRIKKKEKHYLEEFCEVEGIEKNTDLNVQESSIWFWTSLMALGLPLLGILIFSFFGGYKPVESFSLPGLLTTMNPFVRVILGFATMISWVIYLLSSENKGRFLKRLKVPLILSCLLFAWIKLVLLLGIS